jgi:signal transduction histidine kinase
MAARAGQAAHSAMAAADPAATAPSGEPSAQLPRVPLAGFLVAWIAFWILLFTIAVQDHLRQGEADLWRPLLWEGSSFLVASAILGTQWQRLHRRDHLLATPWRWFVANLAWLPVAAVGFVVVVYALRHGVYAALGLRYQHEPWAMVFRYETLKFGMFYLLFVAVLFGVRSHVALADARLRAERARALSQQAQLLQLTQQLEPHFLFNALNTIAATVHTDAQLADTLLTRLAALLRAATDLTRRPEIPLAEELQLVEAYTAIMRERFVDRLAVSFDVDADAPACRVPALVLQPLVENAFRHAVEPHPGRTTLVVRAKRHGARLRLDVQDDTGTLPAVPVFGVGLSNLRKRLAMRYGGDAVLELLRREGGGVIARVDLPCAC